MGVYDYAGSPSNSLCRCCSCGGWWCTLESQPRRAFQLCGRRAVKEEGGNHDDRGDEGRHTEPGQQQLTLAEMKAIAEEAHMWGLKVAAHAHGARGVRDPGGMKLTRAQPSWVRSTCTGWR